MEQRWPCVWDRAVLFPAAQERARFHRGHTLGSRRLRSWMPRLTPGCQTVSLRAGGLWVGTSPPLALPCCSGRGDISPIFQCPPCSEMLQSAQGQQGPTLGDFTCRARASWELSPGTPFSSDLCWRAQAAGGTRRMTRVWEQRRESQPFQQIERELMRGWRAFSIRERSREQGDSAWLLPEKDPESKSSVAFSACFL